MSTSKTDKPDNEQAAMVAMFKHMAEHGGGPAYPQQMQYGVAENGQPAVWFSVGLTKKEQFAAMMMVGMADSSMLCEIAASRAVNLADALLERLKK